VVVEVGEEAELPLTTMMTTKMRIRKERAGLLVVKEVAFRLRTLIANEVSLEATWSAIF